jgi:hypothetical protein
LKRLEEVEAVFITWGIDTAALGAARKRYAPLIAATAPVNYLRYINLLSKELTTKVVGATTIDS